MNDRYRKADPSDPRGSASGDNPTVRLDPTRVPAANSGRASAPPATGAATSPPQRRLPWWLWLVGLGTCLLLAAVVFLIVALRPDLGFTVIIEGAPPNSVVYVDSVRRGIPAADGTIKVAGLKPGPHLLRVTNDGFTDFPTSVTGQHGELRRVTAQLTAAAKRPVDPVQQQRLSSSLAAILETRREERGLVVNLPDVSFDTGQSVLKPAAREKLSKIVGILLAYPEYKIFVEGHTDAQGSDESNNVLSQARADAVRTYVIEAGLVTERIIGTRGYGKTRPVASNDTSEGRQKNRRVEIIVTETENRPPGG